MVVFFERSSVRRSGCAVVRAATTGLSLAWTHAAPRSHRRCGAECCLAMLWKDREVLPMCRCNHMQSTNDIYTWHYHIYHTLSTNDILCILDTTDTHAIPRTHTHTCNHMHIAIPSRQSQADCKQLRHRTVAWLELRKEVFFLTSLSHNVIRDDWWFHFIAIRLLRNTPVLG